MRRYSQFRDYVSANKLLVFFIAVALFVRLAFWLYTGKTWEDAMITLTTARNAWEGLGLTHHTSEPPIQSFSSPLGILVPLIGEAVGQGLLALKLASLLASVATIYYAYRIGQLLSFHWAAQVLMLSYLATDHLQVYFGMSGMETQFAAAVALANAYYYLSSQWWKLGVAVGLGLLTRPEFVFWVPILGVTLLLFERRALLSVIAASAAVAMPWYIFATLYYGSPVPNTILAKTIFLAGDWSRIFDYAATEWRTFAPFLEFWSVMHAPVPDTILKAVVALMFALATLGIGRAIVGNHRLLPIAAFVVAFLVYRTGATLSFYFTWYLVPFTALLVVLAGYGLSAIASYSRPVAAVLGLGLAFAYAMHIPFTFPLDRMVQRDIDEAVRYKTGLKLNELMKAEDTAVLEPLGYIGWAARNKTIYDFPGLASRVSVETLKSTPPPRTPAELVNALKPDFVVLRDGELEYLQRRYQDTAALYSAVARFEIRTDHYPGNLGLYYNTGDVRALTILKRH